MMENRLIFLYHPVGVEARGDGEGQRSHPTVVVVQARRRASYDEKVRPLRREVMTWPQGLKCVIPCFLENPRVEPVRCPYRKPTQVGEEKILRRLRELWLRN